MMLPLISLRQWSLFWWRCSYRSVEIDESNPAFVKLSLNTCAGLVVRSKFFTWRFFACFKLKLSIWSSLVQTLNTFGHDLHWEQDFRLLKTFQYLATKSLSNRKSLLANFNKIGKQIELRYKWASFCCNFKLHRCSYNGLHSMKFILYFICPNLFQWFKWFKENARL